MQHSLINLATAGLLLCTTFFAWSTLQYLGDHDWALPALPSTGSSTIDNALLTKNQELEQALEAARASVADVLLAATAAPSGPMAHPVDAPFMQEKPVQEEATQNAKCFAYVFYATANTYACSALVNIHRLQRVLNATTPIHVIASSDVSDSYISAFNESDVTVHIEQSPELKGDAGGYYHDCLLKLVAFRMHLLDPTLTRVLAFDADQLILKNLDHLFTGLPNVDLAAPRAYWLAKDFLASTFLMINLSDRLWKTVKTALDTIDFNKFDMDLINDLLGDEVMMLSGEYVTLNSHWEDWNLPRWYHPSSTLNMTTVEMLNKLPKSGLGSNKRQTENSPVDGSEAVAQSIAGKPDGNAQVPRAGHTLTMVPPMQSRQPATPPRPPEPGPAWDTTPSPRFPVNHPLTLELYRLQETAAVIHFTAQGKPWAKEPSMVQAWRPDAHPILADQFQVWRETAARVCPNGIPGGMN